MPVGKSLINLQNNRMILQLLLCKRKNVEISCETDFERLSICPFFAEMCVFFADSFVKTAIVSLYYSTTQLESDSLNL